MELYERATAIPEVGSVTKEQTLRLLKKLDALPYRDRKDMNPERIEGTCIWLTDHELFQKLAK
ncbi:hypothetical protein F5Y06DRAFT_228923 [Hypoxylon sp. FL0890]|nr:hypothetical protein F5Y06DRAFT_228923 [Hypoxylon sp. FL0890]